MNKLKKYTSYYLSAIVLGLLSVFALSSCSDDDDDEMLAAGYGYVQFKLYKSQPEGQTTRALTDKLEKLNDAKKIKVLLQHEGATIEQTLLLNAYNDDNAEFCLRSDKLKLLSGNYRLIGYLLYDKVDKELMAGEAGESAHFSIVAGGMTAHTLNVDAVERGMVNFKITKNFVETRAQSAPEYPFDLIKCITLRVKNVFTQESFTIEKMPVKFINDFDDNHNMTSYGLCDSIVWLKAGSYQVTEYTTYSDKKGKTGTNLETAKLTSSPTFVVKDNTQTKDAEVPVKLSKTAEYIKDYQALKAIWEKMDGPHWSYIGEEERPGANWDFENRDIDLWGFQPGVQLHPDGRVAYISLSGFGPRGTVPDEIGQLTELRILYLGTHNELIGGKNFEGGNSYSMTDSKRKSLRMDYYNRVLKQDVRSALSDVLVDGINANPEMKKIQARIDRKDVQAGQLTNGITGISLALKRCVNLEQLYVANSPIGGGDDFFVPIQPESPYFDEEQAGELKWSNLSSLLDVEIYNCPKMDALPMQMLSNLPELQSLNLACNRGISGDTFLDHWTALANPRMEDADETDPWEYEYSSLNYNKIQLMYLGYNNLESTPVTYYLKNMIKLGLLDLSTNKLTEIYPFTKAVNLVQFFLDNNRLTEIPTDSEGYFFGYSDVETFSVSNNLLTELPDIFNAKSNYVIGGVNFSGNQISKLQNGKNHRGYNVSDINLAYNKLTTFPGRLFNAGSPIVSINLAGNGMTSIPEGSLQGPNSDFLKSVDLTYNKLSDLPTDFMATTCPYLFGIDVSYNCFSKFPYEPLASGYLNIFAIRHQRDAQGNRTLREWPTGLYQCPSLVRFFIGSNDLRKIDDTISPYIRIFEIKDNPNITIDLSSVCNYIKAGMYMLVYDKTQDIRGCDALDLQ